MTYISHLKLWLAIMFAILLHYCCYGSIVSEGARDVELENQLKILNKTPIKTIRTEVGNVFDCIDIKKQPSLDHPLLKNHILKTRPIPHPINTMGNADHEVVSSASSFSSWKPSSKIAILKRLNCPVGTVPIRRTHKEDLIRAKLFSQSQLVHSSNIGERDDLENPGQGQFISIAKTRKDSRINYLGISAWINVYNPRVNKDQVSTSQVWIENGPKEELNSLQVGWIVSPSLFGDNRTRLFGKWQVNGSNKSEGCYNILCPGFVQVDKERPIGIALGRVSQYGSTIQYGSKISISQDGGKNWWLDVEDIKIGYWPAELGFSHLSQGSSFIAWGGLAAQLGATKTTIPPTGNGHYPRYSFLDIKYQCFMLHMKVVSAKTRNWEDPTRKIIDTFATNKKCSSIIYYGHKPFGYGHMLAFGGPGGNCQS